MSATEFRMETILGELGDLSVRAKNVAYLVKTGDLAQKQFEEIRARLLSAAKLIASVAEDKNEVKISKEQQQRTEDAATLLRLQDHLETLRAIEDQLNNRKTGVDTGHWTKESIGRECDRYQSLLEKHIENMSLSNIETAQDDSGKVQEEIERA